MYYFQKVAEIITESKISDIHSLIILLVLVVIFFTLQKKAAKIKGKFVGHEIIPGKQVNPLVFILTREELWERNNILCSASSPRMCQGIA